MDSLCIFFNLACMPIFEFVRAAGIVPCLFIATYKVARKRHELHLIRDIDVKPEALATTMIEIPSEDEAQLNPAEEIHLTKKNFQNV